MTKYMKTLQMVVMMCSMVVGMSVLYAAEKSEDKYPLGCKNVGYKYELKTLLLLPEEAGERQSLYFIFNALYKPINLNQMHKDDSTRNMYLNHVIKPREWAVLATSEKELKYICTTDDPKDKTKSDYGNIVDCAESLKVCEYARVKFGLNNKGNYWVVSSNTSGGAVQTVIHYGIIPR